MLQFRVKPLGCVLIIFVIGVGSVLLYKLYESRTIPGTSVPSPVAVASPLPVEGFQSVNEGSPVVSSSISVDDNAKIASLTGKQGSVQGTINSTQMVEQRKDFLVHFNNTSDSFILVIGDDERALFPDVNRVVGRKIVAQGEIFTYKGRPAMRMMSPENLRVVVP